MGLYNFTVWNPLTEAEANVAQWESTTAYH